MRLDDPGGLPHERASRDLGLSALLVSLLLVTFGLTPLVSAGVVGELVAAVSWAVVGIVSVVAIAEHRILAATILVATAIGLATALVGGPTPLSAAISRGSAVLTMAALGGVIGRATFGPGVVTPQRIQGAIALYLVVGIFFAHLFGLVNAVTPGAFSNVPPGLDTRAIFYHGHLVYFSFTTLTSVGYGDIVPVSALARSMAMLEAVIGQLFPATLLARLVSLELRDRRGT
jgi:hypothetical protein